MPGGGLSTFTVFENTVDHPFHSQCHGSILLPHLPWQGLPSKTDASGFWAQFGLPHLNAGALKNNHIYDIDLVIPAALSSSCFFFNEGILAATAASPGCVSLLMSTAVAKP